MHKRPSSTNAAPAIIPDQHAEACRLASNHLADAAGDFCTLCICCASNMDRKWASAHLVGAYNHTHEMVAGHCCSER